MPSSTKKVTKDASKKKTVKNNKTLKKEEKNEIDKMTFNEIESTKKIKSQDLVMSENDKKEFIICRLINYGDDEYLLDEKTNNIYTMPDLLNYYFIGKKVGNVIKFDDDYLKLKKIIDKKNTILKNKSFSIGDKIFYFPKNKEAIIKEIQEDGMYLIDIDGEKITTLVKNIQLL